MKKMIVTNTDAPVAQSINVGNRMGKWGATSYIIGNMVGSGIFITPTTILNNTSSVGLSLVIWTLSAVISALGAYSYLELGTSIRRSGSDFAYLCFVEWRAIAFLLMGGACVMTFPLTLAIQAETFSEYFVRGLNITSFNCAENEYYAFLVNKLIGFSLIWLLLFLNFFSLKLMVARFQIVTSAAKILSAAIVIITGLYYLLVKGKSENIQRPFANSTYDAGRLANAFFSGLFSYDGWDILNFGAEDVENPRVAMSFAVVVGISLVAVLYLLMNLSYFVVLTIPEMRSSVAVAMTFAEQALGDFHYAIPFLVSIVLIGSLNSSLFAASRYMFAAARERQLPAFISCTNLRHDSPRAALFYHVLLAMLFSFLGNIEQLINYVTFAQWLQRSFTMCALLWIRARRMRVHPQAIRAPIVVHVVFLGVCVALVTTTVIQNFRNSLVGLIMLSGGLLVYAFFIWPPTLERFAAFRSARDRLNHWLCVWTQIAFNGVINLGEWVEEDEMCSLQQKWQSAKDKQLEDDQYVSTDTNMDDVSSGYASIRHRQQTKL